MNGSNSVDRRIKCHARRAPRENGLSAEAVRRAGATPCDRCTWEANCDAVCLLDRLTADPSSVVGSRTAALSAATVGVWATREMEGGSVAVGAPVLIDADRRWDRRCKCHGPTRPQS